MKQQKNSTSSLINPLMDCWGRAHPRGFSFRRILSIFNFIDFLFGLQNIVNLKGTLLDCWGRPHPTLEKNVCKAGNSSKNSVHDGIKFSSSCGLIFGKFVKQIALLYRARYSAHFDTKLSSIQDKT
ncbi:hypothetical protein T03_17922 [Trichinella britovi]|uniref:Uncharacterized protein n=1 Tax=Trichinella britovi TaxID=45882 RepID=A0A0V1C7P3_TRIBR|nr:hypothetical protein T03_17922 [Trichinella britovi]